MQLSCCCCCCWRGKGRPLLRLLLMVSHDTQLTEPGARHLFVALSGAPAGNMSLARP